MLKRRICFVTAAVSSLLGLSACEYLGPRMSQHLDLPRNLAIEKVPREPSKAVTPEGIKGTEALKKAEIYPASGPVAGARPSAGRPPAKEGRYTLNFDDADVSEVAKAVLGDILKANYVISPKVTGKVSLQTSRPLAEDELIPTLEMVLRANGAVLIGHKGFYRIEPDANAILNAPGASLGLSGQTLPPGFQLRVVPLRYVSVQEMQKVVEPLLPPKAIIRADNIRNMLLIAGTAEDIEGVIETISLFDVDFMRGMGVGLFPLKNVDAATVAEELIKLFAVDVKEGGLGTMLRLLPIERLNAILAVSPQPRYLSEVENWVERLDRYNTAKAGGVHVYRCQHVEALQLAEILSNIFGRGPGGAGTRPSVAPGFGGTQIGGTYGSGTGSAFGGGGFGSSGTGSGLSSGTSSGLGGSSTSSGLSGGTGSGLSSGTSSGLSGGTGSGLSGGTGGGLGGSRTGSGMSGGIGTGFGGGASGTGRQTTGAAAAELSSGARIVADASTNSLIIVAKAQEYRQIEEVIKELDVMSRQVLIDATIAEVSLTGELQYGLEWFIRSAPSYAVLANGTNLESLSSSLYPASGFAYIFSSNQVKALLHALAKQNKVNILSSPSLMVLNNQEGQIQVGDSVPITTGSVTTTFGGGTVNAVQYLDTGVILTVRPRVNAGGMVALDLIQTVSQPQTTTTSDLQSPTIRKREIKSTVVVKDRDTITLGGLIQDNREQEVSGIPWLSAVPIIGPLFGSYARKAARTELVVLLTPRVVDDRSESIGITNEYRRSLKSLYKAPGLYSGSAVPRVDQGDYATIP